MKSRRASQRLINGSVDPALVPQRVLYTGAKMPAIGLGTFGSDHVAADEIAAAVEAAAEVGYRHFDCASVYGNERRNWLRAAAGLTPAGQARRAVDHVEALERQTRRK